MLALVPLVALLGQVAKVDIRTADTLTSEAVLQATLQVAYAGAGLTITSEHMTVMHAAMAGAYVVEVSGTSYTNEQIDGYWCMNDPLLRNKFKELAVLNTGLTTIDAVHTCVGPSGEPCESSTVCDGSSSGSGGDSGTEEPEPAPDPDTGDGGDGDGDGNSISTAGVILITIGTLACVAVLLYIFWPSIMTVCNPAPTPMVSSVSMTETRPVAKTGAEAFLAGDNL